MLSTLELLFSTTPLAGADQMALDEVLLQHVERPLLRVYEWKTPCVTFGYFQKLEMVKKLYPSWQLVRRWSGGGCVEHGEDLTFSLLMPASEKIAQQAPALFYRRLHEAIVAALQEHQIDARLATLSDQVVGESCFVAPCPCDVMFQQRKIVGGAQRRSKGKLLYQGSLNLGDPAWRDRGVAKLFFLSLSQQLAPQVNLVDEKEEWLADAHQLSLQKYQVQEWLHKR